MCVFACTQKTPNLRSCFLKRRQTNTPRRHRPDDGQLSSIYPPSLSFSSFGAASVMLCCSSPPASSNTPLRPSVCHPSISLVVNIMFIRIFCEHLNVLYVFDPTCIVLKSGWSSTACLVVSPPSLSHSIPPTPPPSRLPDLITLPPLTKFQRVWRRLCEALLSSSFLAPQKHPYLLSRSCLNVRDIKVVLP